MKSEDFIEVIDGVVSNDICKQTIDGFEKLVQYGYGYNRQTSEKALRLYKDDMAANFLDLALHTMDEAIVMGLSQSYNSKILDYVKKYEAGIFGINLSGDTYPISQVGVKVQKTIPSGGYHIWHCENSDIINRGRAIAWMLYLNDIDEGGETEFLYLSKRIKPKAGRLIIWPAGWTHTHRGNPPLESEKYIITGWMETTL